MLRSPIQKSWHALPTWEALCSLARPRISVELSPKTLRNGAMLFARRRSRRSEETADYIRASGQNGCPQRPDTWLHPNVSQKLNSSSFRARSIAFQFEVRAMDSIPSGRHKRGVLL